MCGSVYFQPKIVECSFGVNRIWVSKSKRRSGIASKLLEIALKDVNCHRSNLAFSQPSEAGKRLAVSFTQRKDFLIF